MWQVLVKLMSCAEPNDLRLVLTQLHTISGHPAANSFNAARSPIASKHEAADSGRQIYQEGQHPLTEQRAPPISGGT